MIRCFRFNYFMINWLPLKCVVWVRLHLWGNTVFEIFLVVSKLSWNSHPNTNHQIPFFLSGMKKVCKPSAHTTKIVPQCFWFNSFMINTACTGTCFKVCFIISVITNAAQVVFIVLSTDNVGCLFAFLCPLSIYICKCKLNVESSQ